MGRYMDRVVTLSTENERVRLILLEVMNMLRSPSALFGPSVAMNVLRGALVEGRVNGTTAPDVPHPRPRDDETRSKALPLRPRERGLCVLSQARAAAASDPQPAIL